MAIWSPTKKSHPTSKVVALTKLISDVNDHIELHCSGTFVDLTRDAAASLLITAGHYPLEVGQRPQFTHFWGWAPVEPRRPPPAVR